MADNEPVAGAASLITNSDNIAGPGPECDAEIMCRQTSRNECEKENPCRAIVWMLLRVSLEQRAREASTVLEIYHFDSDEYELKMAIAQRCEYFKKRWRTSASANVCRDEWRLRCQSQERRPLQRSRSAFSHRRSNR